MTTLTEISELKAEMDAKFDRVFDELAKLATDVNGQLEDVRGQIADMHGQIAGVNGRLDNVNAKLDKLLKAHGIDDDEAAA